jgi:hypothetical protein
MKEVKKYKVIAKVSDTKFVKYNVNNLVLFTNFLDKNFSDWRWFNVYSKSEGNEQIANFTNRNRPTKRFI